MLGALAFVLIWLQPQKLFIDVRVDEDLPVAASSPSEPSTSAVTQDSEEPTPETSSAEPSPVPTGPVVVSREDLRLISHQASGVASLVRLPDGSSVIRLEELDVENGPDLRVYLSAAPADGPPEELDDDHVDLGALKGNQGNQNYAIPSDLDLSRYQSVTIWCRRFAVGFAVAPIG
ncbi:MAG: DM13 domain-containing protein [Actinobacteria bacterium]|nr:DM13 domain-containing protein [Actinomycetota bacterium]